METKWEDVQRAIVDVDFRRDTRPLV